MKFIKNNPHIIFLTILAIFVIYMLGRVVYQTNVPPTTVHPGSTVYLTTGTVTVKDGQVCHDSISMIVAPFDAQGGNWWKSIAGFDYSISLIQPGGGVIYTRNLGWLYLTDPSACVSLPK